MMTNGNKNRLHYLVERYLDNSISREELEELLGEVEDGTDPESIKEAMMAAWNSIDAGEGRGQAYWDERFETMLGEDWPESVSATGRHRLVRRWFYRLSVAAAVIFVLGSAGYFLFYRGAGKMNHTAPIASDIHNRQLPPGKNGAVLTLDDGRQIVLDSAGCGTLAVQGGTKILNHYGQVAYKAGNDSGPVRYNTMTTPRGRQYQLVLSDGSRVWLNAASSIRYPVAFAGNERRVEIRGEVYFEVIHNPARPFRVSVRDRGEIEVLGTHFNVNAYEDEGRIATTLLEGSVNVKSVTGGRQSVRIRPGQQAELADNGSLLVEPHADTDAVMAWKNGYFSFNQTDLVTVMRQIARWYDVDVEYSGRVPNRKFGGEISRNSDASQVLKILEESNVHFSIEGKKILVRP